MADRKVFALAVLFVAVVNCCSLYTDSLIPAGDMSMTNPILLEYRTPTSSPSHYCIAKEHIQPTYSEKIQSILTEIETPFRPHSANTISSSHEVRPTPKKGLGVFATVPIPAGTSILVEAPLISIPMPLITSQGFRITDLLPSLTAAFESLSPSDKTIFLSLHDHRFPSEQDQSHLLTVFRSNAYNTGNDQIGLFPMMARINHDCQPNAGNWWSEKTGRKVIYAIRDIEEGEEITVSYIPLLKTTKERQARLAQYGFVCDCAACTDETGDGDKRRLRIGALLEELEGKVGRPSVKMEVGRRRLEKAKKLVELVEKEGLGDYVARAYHLVAVFSDHTGDLTDAISWAEKEWEVLSWTEKDSDEAFVGADFVESPKERLHA